MKLPSRVEPTYFTSSFCFFQIERLFALEKRLNLSELFYSTENAPLDCFAKEESGQGVGLGLSKRL